MLHAIVNFTNKMKKKLPLLLLLFLLTPLSYAQTIYTLDSCKAMALRDNLVVQNSQLRIDAAKEVKRQAFTKFFPSVSASGMGFWLSRYMVDMDYDLGRFQTSFFSPISLSIDLPSVPIQMMKSGFMGGVTAVQPVFAGLRIVRGNQLANLGVRAAELQASMSEDEVIEKVENYYWQIVSLKEKLKTIQALEAQLNNICKDAQAAVEAGVRNRNDLLLVQLKQQELASGRLRVENGIRVCKMILRQYSKIPEMDFDIYTDTLDIPDLPQSYYIESEQAVSQRTESQLLDLQVQAAELQTQMEMGSHLPQVAVGAGYSAYWMDVNKDNNSKNDFGLVFGTVIVPLSGWWEGSHAMKQKRLNEQIARNERENNRQLMAVQIEQSWNELTEAYQQILIAQKSTELAEENLRMQKDGFDAGTVTMSDLLQAQSLLQQSCDDFTDAFVNYQTKKRAYLTKTGRK